MVGTAFHRRPRSAVELRPYRNAEVLQLPCRSVKTGPVFSLLSTNHESPSTNHEILLYYPHRKSLFFSRNADQKALNTAVRKLFLDTVLKICGVERINAPFLRKLYCGRQYNLL